MKAINLISLLCLGAAVFAQQLQYDYDRSADFSSYKRYQWVDYRPVDPGDQLLDQDIKRAVDEQLAAKGLRRVVAGGDLLVGYQTAVSKEKQYDSVGMGNGPGWWAPLGDTRSTSSTIEVGKLVVGLFDPANEQLIWRGSAAETLNISKNPDRNYRTLEKAMAKLFRNYPPHPGKA